MPALESDCEEYQSCKTDSVEDSDIEVNLQYVDDIELDLRQNEQCCRLNRI